MFPRKERWDEKECLICFENVIPDQVFKGPRCRHVTCKDCMRDYIKSQIFEARARPTCACCNMPLELHDIRDLLQNEDLFQEYDAMLLQNSLHKDPNIRWCPAPDCGFAVVVPSGLNCPKLQCGRPDCGMYFCYTCRSPWHENVTCGGRSEAQAETRILEVAKPCPTCNTFIQKVEDGACNHMTCAQCDTQFCWVCLNVVDRYHFIGCFSSCPLTGNRVRISKSRLILLVFCLLLTPITAIGNTIFTSLRRTSWFNQRLRLRLWEPGFCLLNFVLSPFVFSGFMVLSYISEVRSAFSTLLRRLVQGIDVWVRLRNRPYIVQYGNGRTGNETENEDEISSDEMGEEAMSNSRRTSLFPSVNSVSLNYQAISEGDTSEGVNKSNTQFDDTFKESMKSSRDTLKIDMAVDEETAVELEHVSVGDMM